MITTAEWCDGFLAGFSFAVVWMPAVAAVWRMALRQEQNTKKPAQFPRPATVERH